MRVYPSTAEPHAVYKFDHGKFIPAKEREEEKMFVKSNLENGTFLLWNNPKENIWEFCQTPLREGYARLVIDREAWCLLGWVTNPKEIWETLTRALRNGGILVGLPDCEWDLVPLPKDQVVEIATWLAKNVVVDEGSERPLILTV